jgi:hypothetical protein
MSTDHIKNEEVNDILTNFIGTNPGQTAFKKITTIPNHINDDKINTSYFNSENNGKLTYINFFI